jgi:hypothetical protein
LHSTDAGRETSLEEFEAAVLLAPLPEPKPEQKRTGIYVKANRKLPDYAKCLAAKNNARSEADASFVRISLERGFSESEIKAELLEVSEQAQDKNKSGHYKDYFRRTFEFCSRSNNRQRSIVVSFLLLNYLIRFLNLSCFIDICLFLFFGY